MIDPLPFNLPDPVSWAIPLFTILVIAEMVYARGKTAAQNPVRYEVHDTAASLMMGFGNLTAKLLTGVVSAGLILLVYQYRLTDLGTAPWVWVACFFLEDMAYYWFHRISHERRWFWANHIIHHSSQHYNLSTALRQTWTGNLSLTIIFWLPLVFVGFHPAMIAFFSGLSLVYQFWIHTESIGKMGWFEAWFNTPSHHRVHHATNPRYLDANYAGVLIIWDRMFGTFIEVVAEDRPHYGIVSNLGTFNPLKIATHEWVAMFKDVWGAKNWRDRFMFVFGPPGFSPDGSRDTSASLKEKWRAQTGRAK